MFKLVWMEAFSLKREKSNKKNPAQRLLMFGIQIRQL